MSIKHSQEKRVVKAVHGLKDLHQDPDSEVDFSKYLRDRFDLKGLIGLSARFQQGVDDFSILMRRIIWRAAARRFGQGVHIGSNVGFKHLETFEIGNGVFIGDQAYLQGRFDGKLVIGDYAWIGPQSYLDARDLFVGEYVGWGPGAKVLGSSHTGIPIDLPTIQTDLEIRPVRIEAWADIGMNAVILPGVTVGKGSIVGAGSVVTKDVFPFAVVTGVPANFQSWRKGYHPRKKESNEK